MAISEKDRNELWGLVQDALGARAAELLMAGLAATDLDAMEERLGLRIDLVRAELRGEMQELRGEFGELRGEMGELRGEFGELRGEMGELRGEMGELRGEFGELKAHLSGQRIVLFFALVTTIIGIVSLMYAAYQLGQ